MLPVHLYYLSTCWLPPAQSLLLASAVPEPRGRSLGTSPARPAAAARCCVLHSALTALLPSHPGNRRPTLTWNPSESDAGWGLERFCKISKRSTTTKTWTVCSTSHLTCMWNIKRPTVLLQNQQMEHNKPSTTNTAQQTEHKNKKPESPTVTLTWQVKQTEAVNECFCWINRA